ILPLMFTFSLASPAPRYLHSFPTRRSSDLLLSAWIEEERLLVDDREDVGGIAFCRMDARAMAPLPTSSPLSSPAAPTSAKRGIRSEEHTSELQSRFDLVCRLLLEKKKINRY